MLSDPVTSFQQFLEENNSDFKYFQDAQPETKKRWIQVFLSKRCSSFEEMEQLTIRTTLEARLLCMS